MGEKEFSLMKQGSFFINASRGTVVVIPELVKALKSGKLAGSAVVSMNSSYSIGCIPF